MKIALYGATGNIGKRILHEALNRGHHVTAIVRDKNKLEQQKGLTVVRGNIMNTEDVSDKVKGGDAVISAYGPGFVEVNNLTEATRSLIAGVKKSGVQRLIAVGGAATLEVAPGVQLLDSGHLPEEWKPIAMAHKDALDLYLAEKELKWSYLHPAAFIEPGERTEKFRIGGTQLLSDENGISKISMEDYAIAIVDEAEKGEHIRERFSVAY